MSIACVYAGEASNPIIIYGKVKTKCYNHSLTEAFGTTQMDESKGQTLYLDVGFASGTPQPAVVQVIRQSDSHVMKSGTTDPTKPYIVDWDTSNALEGMYRLRAKLPGKEWVDGPPIGIYDVTTRKIKSNRTSVPVESQFEINPGEHYEIGSAFRFELVEGASVPIPDCLKYSLEDTDGLNDVLKSERKVHICDYTFSASGADEGDVYIYWYNDFDGDNGHDSFWPSEPVKESPEFWVMNKKNYSIKVETSDLIATGSLAGIFDDASKLLIKKDSQNDYRACVELSIASQAQFTSGPTRPDPILWNDRSQARLHYDVTDIVFLNDIIGAGGVCWDADWSKIIIGWNSGGNDWRARALAHEFGHGVGLDHAGHSSPQIMHAGYLTSPDVELSKSDAPAYDKGP